MQLPAGAYRVKTRIEGGLFWDALRLPPRSEDGPRGGSRVSVTYTGAPVVPLEVDWTVRDRETGARLTDATRVLVRIEGLWRPWSPRIAASLRTGEVYRFRFRRPGYQEQSYSLLVAPDEPRLDISVALAPIPGTIRVGELSEPVQIRVDGRPHYQSGAYESRIREIPEATEGPFEIVLPPGTYELTARLGPRTSAPLTVEVEPDTERELNVLPEGDAGRPVLSWRN
jgi:hypothetical protein